MSQCWTHLAIMCCVNCVTVFFFLVFLSGWINQWSSEKIHHLIHHLSLCMLNGGESDGSRLQRARSRVFMLPFLLTLLTNHHKWLRKAGSTDGEETTALKKKKEILLLFIIKWLNWMSGNAECLWKPTRINRVQLERVCENTSTIY